MEKLKMHSPDITQENIAKLAELFPNCVTEGQAEDGRLRKFVDFDVLKQELAGITIEGSRERYRLDWPGKSESILVANAPIAKTLRPIRNKSINFDNTRNLFIEGDNLESLKLLQETYLGQVKMIYIDPPYNTGGDFLYADDFASATADYLLDSSQVESTGERLVANFDSGGRFHSKWLSMMLPRLRLARNLLDDDGMILISIDDHEVARLRCICDEVFGADNFIECFVWKRRYGGGAKEKHIVSIHEYVLAYARDIASVPELFVDMRPEQVERYYKLRDERSEELGPYRLQPLEPADSMDDRPNLRFAITAPDGSEVWPKRQWLWGREKFADATEKGLLDFKRANGKWKVSRKQYLRDIDGEQRKTKQHSIIDGIFGQQGSAELAELFGDSNVFPFPKPAALIQLLVEIVTDDGIIMDFFAGSGTTAHAVLAANAKDGGKRRFFLTQVAEPCSDGTSARKAGFSNIAELCRKRIEEAGKKVKEAEELTSQNLDIGFRVLKVDTSNMRDVYYNPDALDKNDLFDHVDNIKEDRTSEDLLFQVLLDWGVDLSLPIAQESIDGKAVFFVDDNALAACFDTGVTEELVKKVATRKPLRVVFRDAGFSDDSVKINVEQIFKLMSPDTEVKAI